MNLDLGSAASKIHIRFIERHSDNSENFPKKPLAFPVKILYNIAC